MSLLESLKNSLVGKVHMPHSHLIDHGVHALTFEAVFSAAVHKSDGKSSGSTESSANEAAKVTRLMGMIERLLRVYDQVDEQLHAGYFFYILMGKTKFVSNSVFVYPIALLLLSYIIPAMFDHIDHVDELKEKEKEAVKANENAASTASQKQPKPVI